MPQIVLLAIGKAWKRGKEKKIESPCPVGIERSIERSINKEASTAKPHFI